MSLAGGGGATIPDAGEEHDEGTARGGRHRFVPPRPGDTLFFHSNLLHASGPNTSDRPRWTLILAYNTRHNDPCKDSHHPRYTPLAKVDDGAIKAWSADPDSPGARETRSYLKPEDDQTISTGKR